MAPENDFIILLVDDDALDVEIFCLALARIDTKIQTLRAVDGQHALEMLDNERSELVKRRVVIFLDVNMPRMNGMEFLAHIRTDTRYSGLPVIVFSTSGDERDMAQANQHNVTGFITKRPGVEKTVAAMRSLIDFLNLIEIPQHIPSNDKIKPDPGSRLINTKALRRLLIVDDSEFDMDSIRRAATKLGIDTYWVHDKETALEELAASRYDAVVSDFRLGISDADELVAAISEIPNLRSMPILVVSGSRPPNSMMPNIVRNDVQVFSKEQISSAVFSNALAKSVKLSGVEGTLG